MTRISASRCCWPAPFPAHSWRIAVPLGTIIAIYLSEFAGHKTREVLKPMLELLSGI